MRIIGEIPHPSIKITLFHWNNKYLIKLETPLLEQTFKIPDYDLASETELSRLVDTLFLEKAVTRFDDMALAMNETLQRNEDL